MILPQLAAGITEPGLNFGSQEELLLIFVKLMFVLGGLLYVIFAIVVIRQVGLMRSTVETGFSLILLLISLAHFIFALLALLYFIGM